MTDVREMNLIDPIAEHQVKGILTNDNFKVGDIFEDGTKMVKAMLTDESIVFVDTDGIVRVIGWNR